MLDIKDFPVSKIVKKFGRLPDIDSAEGGQDVWDGEDAYVWPAAAATMKVSSSDAKDTSAGVGVKSVRIFGLDANYKIVEEDITMNGQTGVTISTDLLRIYRMYALAPVGSEGDNAGDIWAGTGTITTGVPAVKYAGILASHGQTLMAIYTIPKIDLDDSVFGPAMILRWYATVSAGQAAYATVALQTRSEGGPWRSRRIAGIGEGGYMSEDLTSGIKLTTGSDIRVRVVANGVNNSAIEAGFDLALSKAY